MTRKLNDQKVWAILGSSESLDVLAERHGITKSMVCRIKSGQCYRRVYRRYVAKFGEPPRHRKNCSMTREQHTQIMLATDVSHTEIDRQFGFSHAYTSSIRRGLRFQRWFAEFVAEHGEPGPYKRATMKGRRLTRETVLSVLNDSGRLADIAARHGISPKTASAIRCGNCHRAIYEEWLAMTSAQDAPKPEPQPEPLVIDPARYHPMITQPWGAAA